MPLATVSITFACHNSAFDDGNGGGREAARILRHFADQIERSGDMGAGTGSLPPKDANGNVVGTGYARYETAED